MSEVSSSPHDRPTKRPVFLLILVFFLSGGSALIFGNLWFRQAGLAFGNSVWASALVLAGFMGGLGLGNALAARYGHRVRRPVFTYACLEIIIAASGVFLVYFLPFVGSWLAPVFRAILASPWAVHPLRFAFALSLLLVPSTAMGATLPLLVKALLTSNSNFGQALGRLYGWNTLGAVLGVLTAEVVLIEWAGIRGTAWIAALCNAVAAGVAAWLSRSFAVPSETALRSRALPFFAGLSPAGRRLLVAALLSGGVLLALEVVWFRFLLLFFHGDTLAFALMLAAVLAGIGAGGLCASWWLSARPGHHRFAASVALIAGSAVALIYSRFDAAVAQFPTLPIPDWWSVSWLACVLMLPPCLLSGILFTLIGQALKEEMASETQAAGMLTLANTAGGMLGSLLGGFVLLPTIGVEKSFFSLAVTYGGIAFLAMNAQPKREALSADPPKIGQRHKHRRRQDRRQESVWTIGSRWARIANVPAAAIFVLLVFFFPFGRMERQYLSFPLRPFALEPGTKVIAIREGLTETIQYLEVERFGFPLYHRLITNGFTMSASNVPSRRYMELFVYWPVAVHPNPRRALLISYGLGRTAKALTDTASLEQIDIVDISRDILEMSSVSFSTPEENPLHDPRTRVYVEDGRYFLQVTSQKYDLITAEPPPPRNAGIVNLYTREYFRLIYNRLDTGGIATYWLPAHNLNPSGCKSIIKAFCEVFEECSLWAGSGLDWMLAGARDAQGPVSEGEFVRQWADPIVAARLRAVGLETPEQLGSLFMADATDLRRMVRDVPALVDNYPKRIGKQLPSPEDEEIYASWMETDNAKTRFANSKLIARLWPRTLQARTLSFFDAQALINSYLRNPENVASIDQLHRVLAQTTLRTLPLWLMGSSRQAQQIARKVRYDAASRDFIDYHRGVSAMADRDYSSAEDFFRRLERRGSRIPTLSQYGAYALCATGQPERARALARLADASGNSRENRESLLPWVRSACESFAPTPRRDTTRSMP